MALNVDLNLRYVPSKSNMADFSSRVKIRDEMTLAPETWQRIQMEYGPHDGDLMALDSNAMKDVSGRVLKHFTPTRTPFTSGVAFFAQDLSVFRNPYVFPPAPLVSAVFSYLKEFRVPVCTVVVFVSEVRPTWWPEVATRLFSTLTLGNKGEKGIVLRTGYKVDSEGLSESLQAIRFYGGIVGNV